MDRAIPILPSSDLDATARFYGGLGFEPTGRHPSYLLMARGPVELHFFACPGIDPENSDFMAYIRVEDPDAWVRELAALGLPRDGTPRLVGIEDKPWGMREFAIVDPDGTLLRIGRPTRQD